MPTAASPLHMPSLNRHVGRCRYTVIKNGQRRLFMPNAAFITREFMVVDGPERRIPRAGRRGSKTDAVQDKAAARGLAQAVSGPSDRPVWLNSPPYS